MAPGYQPGTKSYLFHDGLVGAPVTTHPHLWHNSWSRLGVATAFSQGWSSGHEIWYPPAHLGLGEKVQTKAKPLGFLQWSDMILTTILDQLPNVCPQIPSKRGSCLFISKLSQDWLSEFAWGLRTPVWQQAVWTVVSDSTRGRSSVARRLEVPCDSRTGKAFLKKPI